MSRLFRFQGPALLLGALLAGAALAPATPAAGQQKAAPPAVHPATEPATRAVLLASARKLMGAQKYCAFITVDAQGRAQARTINPFPPEADMTVWFATSTVTRKAAEIRANPHVALYYADHGAGTGYVQLSGRAVLVTDRQEIEKRRRAYWSQSFPGDRNLVLVKVVPDRLDVLDYANGIRSDSITWRAPFLDVRAGAEKRK